MNKNLIYIAVVLAGLLVLIFWTKNQKKSIISIPQPNDMPIPTLPKEDKKQPEPEKLKDVYQYQEGLDVAKKLNKNIFLLFNANNCGWCVKLEKEVLANSEIKELTKNYIIIHVNASAQADLVTKYGVQSTPTYFMLDSQGKTIKMGRGYKNVADFKGWLALPALAEQ